MLGGRSTSSIIAVPDRPANDSLGATYKLRNRALFASVWAVKLVNQSSQIVMPA
jgi:hypothetical protein